MFGDERHPTSSPLITAIERLCSEPATPGVLALMVPLALDVLPAAQQVSVSLPGKDGIVVVAASGPESRELAEMEHLVGEGPGLAGAREGQALLVADLAQDHRWPRLAVHVAGRIPVHSVLSLPLGGGLVEGSLNAFSAEIGAFTGHVSARGIVFAAAAGLALRAAEERERADQWAARAAQVHQRIALVGEDLTGGVHAALSAGQILDGRRSLLDATGKKALDQLNDALLRHQRLVGELLDRPPPGEGAR